MIKKTKCRVYQNTRENLLRSGFSLVFISALIFMLPGSANSWKLPQDYYYSEYYQQLLDNGIGWETNSMFHPVTSTPFSAQTNGDSGVFSLDWRYQYIHRLQNPGTSTDSTGQNPITLLTIYNMTVAQESGEDRAFSSVSYSPSIWAELHFMDHWYIKGTTRATNEAASLDHFSALPRGISRAGLNALESDRVEIGFRWNRFSAEFGRGREIWGSYPSESLILSESSPAWERLALQISWKRFTYRWFFGFLEAIHDFTPEYDLFWIQRYISGRGLEYANGRNLVLGAGELIVLAGPNRPIDIAYLNPIGFHIEIEQNARNTTSSFNYENSFLFFTADWLALPSLRLSGTIIVDEFKLENSEREAGQTDDYGIYSRLAWTPINDPVSITFISNYTRNETFLYNHVYGMCNFVHRNSFLGSTLGNDAEEIQAGMRAVFHFPAFVEIYAGQRRRGENSLYNDQMYESRTEEFRSSFPSGSVSTTQYIRGKLHFRFSDRFAAIIEGEYDMNSDPQVTDYEHITFSLAYTLPVLYRVQ